MRKRRDLRELIGMSEEDSFKKYLSLIQEKSHVQWEPQHKFVMDKHNNKLVDFIGRLESFEHDVYAVLDKLGFGRTIFGLRLKRIPHKNKGTRSDYRDYYDTDTKEIVSKLYQKDVEFFGYQF